MYSYCYGCSVLCLLFHCVVLCTVCVEMCSVLLPLGVNPIAVNKCININIKINITCLLKCNSTVPVISAPVPNLTSNNKHTMILCTQHQKYI